jgi:hypothetical protein
MAGDSRKGRWFKFSPRNHQAEHLSGVQQTLGARLDQQPSPSVEAKFRKFPIRILQGQPVSPHMLRRQLSECPLAEWAAPRSVLFGSHPNVFQSLSEELAPQWHVGP